MKKLRLHFSRILKRASDSAAGVMRGLAAAGIFRASADEIRATAENIVLVATFWLNFDAVRHGKTESGQLDIGRGIHQVMMLIAPFLRDSERLHLNTLASAYLR